MTISLHSLLRCLLAGLSFWVATHVHAQNTALPAAPAIPWDARSWEDRAFKGAYEDFHTFKHKKSFPFDPFVWAYSQEFADKFRMPREWVDPELRGAMAVAWRMTTIGQTTCGLGGRADNCWPALTCQMDVYFDSKTPLPWRYTDVVRDNFMRGIASIDYLPPLSVESRTLRYGRAGSKGEPLLTGAFNYLNSETTTSGFLITYFDREFEPGVTLVGFRDTCPRAGMDGPAVLKFFSAEEQRRTRGVIERYDHEILFSRAYMKKITEAYAAQNKPNEDITKRLMQDFFNSRKGDPNFSPRQ
jgi:hypothetical protein